MAVIDERFDVVPTHLAVEAMRDNGYKNAAYAIAELMDNAIQAEASVVELLCCETEEQLAQRKRRRIKQVAVLDNGVGMNADELRMALQFGNGTRLLDRSGMGRFGMGLPSASISQCSLIEVWSWQHGVDSPLYTYIDLKKIEQQQQVEIPKSVVKPIPDLWRSAGRTFRRSGTLVVWSRLDRIMWRTAKAIIDNSEELIGRMYRGWLHRSDVTIRLAAFLEEAPTEFSIEETAQPNDPGYLITPSSTPKPYDETPMFQTYGDRWEIPLLIKYRAGLHTVTLRFTYAKEEARRTDNAGALPYGQHARRNVGVSVVRAGRELELDQSFVIQYDPRERWWGVEVDFPPALDELFGVTNNKQSARTFTDLGSIDYKKLLQDRRIEEVREEYEEDGDPRGPLLEVGSRIDRTLAVLREAIAAQAKNRRGPREKRHPEETAEGKATAVTRQRQEEGYKGASDEGEKLPAEQRQAELTDELIDSGVEPDLAEEQAAWTVDNGMKYLFVKGPLEGATFFTVKTIAGEILVKINTKHAAYQHLVEVLDEAPPVDAVSNVDELAGRLVEASKGLKLLMMSWARLEDEQQNSQEVERLQDIRYHWGRYAARFLERPE